MTKNFPTSLLTISKAADVDPVTIYRTFHKLTELDSLILRDALIIVNQATIEKLVKEITK